jgi:hypothetical protein
VGQLSPIADDDPAIIRFSGELKMTVRGKGPRNPFTRYEVPGKKKDEQKMTTMAVGEEGGKKPGKPGHVTTKAIGEEGGGKPGHVTTKALGEEGGTKPPPDMMTTLAVGEEGGSKPKPKPDVTTMAVGEEGGGTFTTMAMGEESGSR